MGQQLSKGDVFLLTDGHHVLFNKRNVEVGRVYKEGKDRSELRFTLKSDISNLLYKKGINADYDIVSRFVNYVAKDVPESTFVFPMGHFVVIRVDTPQGVNQETVHCRRLHPEPGQNADEISFLQNQHGKGPYPFHIHSTLAEGEY